MSEIQKADDDLTVATDTDVPGLLSGVISFRAAVLYGIAALGVGDFLADGGAYFSASGAGYASWLTVIIGVVLVLGLSKVITGLAGKYVVSGSLMSYLYQDIGPRTGLLAGAGLTVGYLAMVGAFVATTLYFGLSFLAGLGVSQPSNPVVLMLAAALIIVVALLVRRGVSVSVKVTIALSYLIVPVAVVLVVGSVMHSGVPFGAELRLQGFDLAGLVGGVVMMFGFYAGFEGFTALAKETANPTRTVPLVVTSVVIVVAIATLLSVFLTVPIMMDNADALAAGASPLRVLADTSHLDWLGLPADGLLTLALFGSMVAYLQDASRITAAAGTEGLLPKVFSRVNPRYHTPTVAISAFAVMSFVLITVSTLANTEGLLGIGVAMVQMTAVGWLYAYIATAGCGLIKAYRQRHHGWAVAYAALVVVQVALLVYFITHTDSTFITVFSWCAVLAVPVLWVTAVIRTRKKSNGAPTTDELSADHPASVER